MGNESNFTLDAGEYAIQIGAQSLAALQSFVQAGGYSSTFILTDENVAPHWLSQLQGLFPGAAAVTIPPGERHKTIQTCMQLWDRLTEAKADRKALLINLGGGMVGDLGGYAASCYKRGIDFVQVPTTLLAMVDASVGGKTGINFGHFKNQIGLFRNPRLVLVDPGFLSSLPDRELRSGYAELLKHCLIADADRWAQLKAFEAYPPEWAPFILESIKVKLAIVSEDPFEKGPRKALNFGHTIGHAIESHLMEDARPLLHGEAVAAGMVCEAHISMQKGLLSSAERDEIAETILRIFGHRRLPETDFEPLAALALQDKKNQGGRILCTLLNGIGAYRVDQEIDQQDILDSLSYYNSIDS